MGIGKDEDTLKAIRAVTRKTLRVDANEGWKTKEEALDKIQWLEQDGGVEFVEQPMRGDMTADHAWLRERVKMPIIADEACTEISVIPALAGVYDGLNVKLDKAGGILAPYRWISIARALGMKTMLGCMVSVDCGDRGEPSPLVDYADLDGNLLISNDRYRGVTVPTRAGSLRFRRGQDWAPSVEPSLKEAACDSGIGAFIVLSMTAGDARSSQTPFRSGIDLIQVDAVVGDGPGIQCDAPTHGLPGVRGRHAGANQKLSAVNPPAAALNTSIPPLESALTAFGPETITRRMGARSSSSLTTCTCGLTPRASSGCSRLRSGCHRAARAGQSSRRGRHQFFESRRAFEFTGDKARRLAAVKEFLPAGGGVGGPPGSSIGALKTAFAMSKLSGVTRTLAMVQHRRKAVVLIVRPTVGLDPVNPDAGGAANAKAALSDTRDFIRTAQRSNVAIYAFDPGNQIRNPLSDRRQKLITIAEATGGFATVQAANADAAGNRMVAENGVYLLGYTRPQSPSTGSITASR